MTTLVEVEDKEIGLDQVLARFLEDDQLKDITLKGTDGVQVRANKYVLASRSKVFQQMLLGRFSEASSPEVELGYEGSVLKAVVEYIHTDSAHLLNAKKRKQTENNGNGNKKTHISSLVSLSDAAMYFNLPGLCQKVHKAISKEINQNPTLSFHFLAACRSEGPAVPEKVSKLALRMVREKARDHITADAVQGLNAFLLEDILRDENMEMAEEDLFNMLHLWTGENPTDLRKLAAKELLQRYITLENIDPLVLSSTVASSGLATTDQLLEAYKQQALAAREKTPGTFKKFRKIPSPSALWKNSKTEFSSASGHGYEIDLLNCSPMASGVHKWKIELTEESSICDIVIGVVHTGMRLHLNQWLGSQMSFWGLACRMGRVYCPGTPSIQTGVAIQQGQTVTFTLNLLQECEGNGTLSRSIEEGPQEILCSNLLDSLKKHPEGFVPVVSTYKPARVCLVDIQKLQD